MVTSAPGDQGLLSIATTQLEKLLQSGRIFWEESTPEYVEHNGFKFEFRIVPAFASKPIPKKGSNEPAKGEKGKDPFTDPEEGFVVSNIGSSHVLQPNKFCTMFPQLLLHTKEFAEQTEDLDLADFKAGLDVLKQLKEPWVMFFNCGLRAGSSQGHKHLQLIPKPKEEAFVLFPDQMKDVLSKGVPSRPPKQFHVPYDCLVAPLQTDTTAEEIYATYNDMLDDLRHLTKVKSERKISGAHNMIMTLDWMCIIPRQRRGEDGIYTNAMGMLGLVWVKDQAERDGWNKLHLTEELRKMGAPPSSEDDAH